MFKKKFKGYIVDKIKDGWVFLHDESDAKNKIDIPVEVVENVREGDLVLISKDGEIITNKEIITQITNRR